MAKRQREWARRKRDEIFNALGRKCAQCGATEKLEFDVIIPIGDAHTNSHHSIEWSHRMSFYRKQLDQNNLQILCERCNNKKQNQMQLLPSEPPNQPF